MDNILVSVIVPVYRVEPYLKKCIESIINQTYKNLEIILVDDGSPDNCPQICDEYAKKDPRIKVIHKKNGGVSSARNAGIDEAKGEYLCFCDSDDLYHENYVQKMVEAAKLSGEKFITCGLLKIQDGQNQPITYKEGREIIESREQLFRLYKDEGILVVPTNKLYHKSIIGNIRFFTKIKTCEDWRFNLEVLKNQKSFYHINDCLYFYLVRENSACTGHVQNTVDIIENYNLNSEYFGENVENLKTIQSEMISQLFARYAFLIKNNRTGEVDEIYGNSQISSLLKTLKASSFKTKLKLFLLKNNCQRFTKLISKYMNI